MNRKGILLMYSAFLFGMLLMNFTSQVMSNSIESQEKLAVVSGIDISRAKYENIEDNIRDMMEHVLHESILIGDNNIAFVETLPDKDRSDEYSISLERYKKFALMFPDGLDLNIDANTLTVNDLVISAYDINYNHESAGQKGKKAENQMNFEPERVDFNKYVIEITVQNQNYDENVNDIRHCGAGCALAIGVDVRIYDSKKILQDAISDYNIDPMQESTIVIQTSGQSSNDIVITIGPENGNLSITNYNSVAIDLVAGISFGDYSVGRPYIEMPRGIISVGKPEFNVRKN